MLEKEVQGTRRKQNNPQHHLIWRVMSTNFRNNFWMPFFTWLPGLPEYLWFSFHLILCFSCLFPQLFCSSQNPNTRILLSSAFCSLLFSTYTNSLEDPTQCHDFKYQQSVQNFQICISLIDFSLNSRLTCHMPVDQYHLGFIRKS